MTDFYQLPHEEQLRRLLLLAQSAVSGYALPAGVSVKMINLSENATYKIEDASSDRKWARWRPSAPTSLSSHRTTPGQRTR